MDLDEVFTGGYFELDESGHCSQTKVICIENTHNMLGGLVLQVKVEKFLVFIDQLAKESTKLSDFR